MATQQQMDTLIDALSELKKECDLKSGEKNGNIFVYCSLKLTNFIMITGNYNSSVLSESVISELTYWTRLAIDAMRTSSPADDIPALNIIIGKLAFQFP